MPAGKLFCVVSPVLPLISGLYRNSIINVDLDHCDPETATGMSASRITPEKPGLDHKMRVCMCVEGFGLYHTDFIVIIIPQKENAQSPNEKQEAIIFLFSFPEFFLSLMEPSRVLSCSLSLSLSGE